MAVEKGSSTAPNPNLTRLHEAGVSVWLDTLSRDLLRSGEFAALIRDYSVTGATSNPTIFAKAITGSDLYDGQLRELAAAGEHEAQGLFFSLALDDVLEAARLLLASYERSGGRDGFISFECTPDLADDAGATIEQATDLWQRLDRPNVMIKVPGTEAGLPAIEELTRQGVNVNVTLLFSVERYERGDRRLPTRSCCQGARRRTARSDHLGRVVLPLADRHQGRRAAAGGLAASRRDGDRLCPRCLSALPGEVRRPRMGAPRAPRRQSTAASVGEHRHQEPRVLRRALRGGLDRTRRDQHDARPDAARLRRPRARDANARRGPAAAARTLLGAAAAGIDLAAVTFELEREGVQSFCDSYHQLLDCIRDKLGTFAGSSG